MSDIDYLQLPYARIVIPSEEGGFHAEILEFPGCYAQGETPDEAYSNLEKSAKSWIAACQEQNQEIPEPFSTLGFSGKVALRLPRSIHRQAVRLAERDRTSLNQFLLSAISSRVGAEDMYSVMMERFKRELGSRPQVVIQLPQQSHETAESSAQRISGSLPISESHLVNTSKTLLLN